MTDSSRTHPPFLSAFLAYVIQNYTVSKKNSESKQAPSRNSRPAHSTSQKPLVLGNMVCPAPTGFDEAQGLQVSKAAVEEHQSSPLVIAILAA